MTPIPRVSIFNICFLPVASFYLRIPAGTDFFDMPNHDRGHRENDNREHRLKEREVTCNNYCGMWN